MRYIVVYQYTYEMASVNEKSCYLWQETYKSDPQLKNQFPWKLPPIFLKLFLQISSEPIHHHKSISDEKDDHMKILLYN